MDSLKKSTKLLLMTVFCIVVALFNTPVQLAMVFLAVIFGFYAIIEMDGE